MGTLLWLKQFLTGGTGEARYACLSCRARFERQHQVCPECGGYDIRRTEWIDKRDSSSPEKGT